MPRKTYEVEKLRQHVNNNLDRMKNAELFEEWVDLQIKEGYTPAQIARLSLATVLEGVLFQTDNYHGFMHRDGNLGVVDPTLREYLMDTMLSIKCGKCGGYHASVQRVKDCYFPPRQPSPPPATVAQRSHASFSTRFVKHPFAEVTVPQLNKIQSLGGDVVHAAKLNRGEASDYIERLITAKENNQMSEPIQQVTEKPATIIPMDMLMAFPDGRYAARQDENDEYDFFRVSRPKSGRFRGALKIQTQHSDLLKEALIVWPSGRVSVYNYAVERNLLLAILDPRSAGIRFGRHIGRCMKCGKTLTDNRSRYYGIGPDCEKDYPETIEEVEDIFGPYHPGKEIE